MAETYREFLTKFKDLNWVTGDLARDALADKDWKGDDIYSLYSQILMHGGGEPARQAFLMTVRDYWSATENNFYESIDYTQWSLMAIDRRFEKLAMANTRRLIAARKLPQY